MSWEWLVASGWVEYTSRVLQIIGIDIILAGDNAVVIALACRSLPPEQRKWGVILGAGVAVLLRIIFAGFITVLMNMPWLKLVGGLLLFWIAFKLLKGEEAQEKEIEGSTNLWGAVRTVAIADLVMSLDNVIAIAGVAKGDIGLIAFGLIVSIPLVVGGAALILGLLTRYPILIWAGAALLGKIAGDMIASEMAIADYTAMAAHALGLSQKAFGYVAAAAGALLVILLGLLFAGKPKQKTEVH